MSSVGWYGGGIAGCVWNGVHSDGWWCVCCGGAGVEGSPGGVVGWWTRGSIAGD